MSEIDFCVDCGRAIVVCEHASKRLTDPIVSHALGVEEDLRSRLVASEQQARALAERVGELRAALEAQQEHEDWLEHICTLKNMPTTDDEIEIALDASARLNRRAFELRRELLARPAVAGAGGGG